MHEISKQDIDEVIGGLTFAPDATSGKQFATVWHPHEGQRQVPWPVHDAPSRVKLPWEYAIWTDATHDHRGFLQRLFEVAHWHEKQYQPIHCFLVSGRSSIDPEFRDERDGTAIGYPLCVDERLPRGFMYALDDRGMRIVSFLEKHGPMSRADARLVAVTLLHGSDLFDREAAE